MLSALEVNTITRGLNAARKALEEVKPVLDGLDVIYNSAGGAKDTITQQNLDADTVLSGLTKQQLDDGMFALTSSLKTAIANAYAQLAQLAARA